MDYKNLNLRIISSFFLLFIFFVIYTYEKLIPFIFIFIYSAILYEIVFFLKIRSKGIIFLLLYIFISFVSSQIYLIYYFNKLIFIYFVLLIISFDTSSYILGSIFGKRKIFPEISPNKTYIGFLGGLLFSLVFSFFYNLIFDVFNFFTLFLFWFFIILSAFFGDLIESFYKRISNIRHSSNFIPGHGGIFDRFDGFVLSMITILIISYFYEKIN